MLNNITDRIRLFFRKNKESYLCFYRILGFFPKDISIYEQALMHKSTTVRSEKGHKLNNERLEFLGDAILDAIVADIVYKKFVRSREGFLTNTRSKIVQRETLNKIAQEIGLDKLVRYNNQQFAHNSYMGGNAFEALVGAIYLDRGYRACKAFMEKRIIGNYLDIDKLSKKEVNFKSRLIEWCQKNKYTIEFLLVSDDFEKTNSPIFECEVLIEGLKTGSGKGYSKKESHQAAAHEAYNKVKRDPDIVAAISLAKENREKTNDINASADESSSVEEHVSLD